MTPGARVAAAIEVLNDVADGLAAEQALTRWGRRSRFAGSKDRAAVRDHVFDVMRCLRTAQHFGQGTDGRALMIGLLYQQGADLDALFNDAGHAPAPLSSEEKAFPPAPSAQGVHFNLPDWLVPQFETSLGDDAARTAQALQQRAPITLRVNTAKTSLDKAAASLSAEGVETVPNPLATTALTIREGARKLRNSTAYAQGWVELQDAASQAVVADIPAGGRVLDYCAGGGGKALALAMDPSRTVFAHDADPRRMVDITPRAARAGASIQALNAQETGAAAPFDVVLCDAPCSGAGAWRRAPQGKWLLTQEKLAQLNGIQDEILDAAAKLVGPNGVLVYATCSVLSSENEDRVQAFLTCCPNWKLIKSHRFNVDDDGDGFFAAHLKRE